MRLRELSRERYLVTLALLTAFSVTAFAIESWLPKPLPFLRLGLANIPVVLLLYTGNTREAIVVGLMKVFLGSVFSGLIFSPTTLISLGATVSSMLAMYLLIRLPFRFSLVGISVGGAVAHNLAQLAVVRLAIFPENDIFRLTPALILLGIGTGFVTGYLVGIFHRTIYRKYYANDQEEDKQKA